MTVELFIINNTGPNSHPKVILIKSSINAQYRNMEVDFNLISNTFLREIKNFIISEIIFFKKIAR